MKKTLKVKENAARDWRIPPLVASDNKYTRGAVLILGGEEMTGAARLAAMATQRAGAGLVTIATTEKSWPVYSASLMSVIARPMTTSGWKKATNEPRVSAVLIGPGAGVNARTKQAMLTAATCGKPLVLDADALTLLAMDAGLREAMRDAPKILTPHAGECARLVKALKISARVSPAEAALALARILKAVVVLKGSETLVTDGKDSVVTHPPHWLATAGTGDVLAGVILALVGQGMTLRDAANAGVWLHTEAAREHGHGMIAEDVIASLPTVLRSLNSR